MQTMARTASDREAVCCELAKCPSVDRGAEYQYVNLGSSQYFLQLPVRTRILASRSMRFRVGVNRHFEPHLPEAASKPPLLELPAA